VGTSPSVATGGTVPINAHAILRTVASKAGMTASPGRRGDYQITGAVQAGNQHALVLKTNRSVWGWGVNANGQLGTGDIVTKTTPTQASGITDAVGISSFAEASGSALSLAVMSNGTVKGWGKNSSGQTGIGSSGADVLTPTAAPSLSSVVAVSAGHGHGLALKSDGTVWAWGLNGNGQIGNNASGGSPVLTPAQVVTAPSTPLTNVVAIAAGSYFSMALKRDGTVMAWGLNAAGQIGDGTTTQRKVATPVTGLTGVVAIAAGREHALALKTNGDTRGELWGWGTNANPRPLGLESITYSTTPLLLSSDVYAIGAGNPVSLWLRNEAGAQPAIWGAGLTSVEDFDGVSDLTIATKLTIGDFVAVDGAGTVKLALRRDTTVLAWGSNEARYGDGFALGTSGAGGQDPDNDGLTTAQEWTLGTDPLDADTNDDGIPDGVAVLTGLSPTNLDMDADGVINKTELQNGTDPFRADTDSDTVNDGADCYPLDPTRTTCPPPDPNDHTPPVITLTEPTNAVLISSVP
jgi:alpha-tubulin suppressor-like RCC1 family protein